MHHPPAIAGLDLELVEGCIPAFFARNHTGQLLEVAGLDGEPFLRLGPDGVQANIRSPTYYRAGGHTIRAVPADADPDAEPAWTTLSSEPAWAWLEHRARVPGRGERPFALGTRRETVLRWTTLLTLGGQSLPLHGRVEWVPSPTAQLRHGTRAGLLGAAATAAAAAVALVLRRRGANEGAPGRLCRRRSRPPAP